LSTRFSEMVSPLQALEKGECEQLKAEWQLDKLDADLVPNVKM
jgi:hypothetical protein